MQYILEVYIYVLAVGCLYSSAFILIHDRKSGLSLGGSCFNIERTLRLATKAFPYMKFNFEIYNDGSSYFYLSLSILSFEETP